MLNLNIMGLGMDLDYRDLSQAEVIKKYQWNLDILRKYASENRIKDEDFDRYVSEHISRMVMHRRSWQSRVKQAWTALERNRRPLAYTFVLLAIILTFLYKREVSAVLLRHIQVYIYPVMKLWRRITAPMILFFPSLMYLYDESCLLKNPYFQVSDLNCSPCASVVNVLDLSNFQHLDAINENVPYMFRTDQRQVTLRHFLDIYGHHKDVFEKDAFQVRSSHEKIHDIIDLGTEILNRTHHPESHNVWRCNRMEPARLLRKYFPHPKRFPQTGTSLERFLLFDTPEAKPYRIPDTECSNVFLTQVQGNRKIVLKPTQECRTECRTLSIRLPTSYVCK